MQRIFEQKCETTTCDAFIQKLQKMPSYTLEDNFSKVNLASGNFTQKIGKKFYLLKNSNTII